MIMQNGRVFVAVPSEGWQEIGRARERYPEWTRSEPAEPQQILSGIRTPQDLAAVATPRELSVQVALDPAIDGSLLWALWSGRQSTVAIERRLRAERGVRPPTGAGRRKDPASPYPTRAAHARARAHRTALERRDRRRTRAGNLPLGPYSAVLLRFTIPNAQARLVPNDLARGVVVAFRGLTGTLTSVGGSIRSIIASLVDTLPRFPDQVAGAVLAHPPTAEARELAAELSRDRQCNCRACIQQRAMADVDDLRSIPWTTEQIATYDPPETHRDRVVVDAETGRDRLDNSGRGGSWADFLRRVDELIDEPPAPGPALHQGNDQR